MAFWANQASGEGSILNEFPGPVALQAKLSVSIVLANAVTDRPLHVFLFPSLM